MPGRDEGVASEVKTSELLAKLQDSITIEGRSDSLRMCVQGVCTGCLYRVLGLEGNALREVKETNDHRHTTILYSINTATCFDLLRFSSGQF